MKIRGRVPSGSYFTQLIDSVVNYVISIYVHLRVFGKWYATYVLGDNSIYAVPQETDLNVFHSEYELIGFPLSLDKSLVKTDFSEATFFGHKFHGTSIDRDDELIYEQLLTKKIRLRACIIVIYVYNQSSLTWVLRVLELTI